MHSRQQQRIYSREFLGVVMVPFTSRPRKATDVVFHDGYFVARLPNPALPKIAISSDDAFKPNFDRNDYIQRSIARVLRDVGCISAHTYDDFNNEMKSKLTDQVRKKMASKINDFEELARDLGIELTKDQNAILSANLKITAS